MFKNLQVYRLPRPYHLSAADLAEAIAHQSFAPCTKSEAMRQGWVSPRGTDELVHTVNRQMLLALRTETKVLPSAVINQAVRERAAELEEQQGFAPGKKATKELKERITDELLVKAFSKHSNMWVWIDPVNGWLVVDTPSPAKADDAIKLLLKAVDRMPLESLRVQRSPVAVMTGWLDTDEAPGGFTIDQNATLRATGESKATVTYKLHSLDPEDMRRHIATGKQCVRLAMTWDSKISFSLTEGLCIKGVKALDIIKEGTAVTHSDDERFDNDMMLMTGECAKMLAELVEALGGEATDTQPEDSTALDAARKLHQLGKDNGASITLTHGDKSVTFGAKLPEDDADDATLYEKAVAIVRTNQRASISHIQRHLVIGYNRAARLIERMEKEGIVSPMDGGGHREVLTSNQ